MKAATSRESYPLPDYQKQFENLPAELRSTRSWILWRLEDELNAKGEIVKPKAKMPVSVSGHRLMKWTDAQNHLTFEQVIDHLSRVPALDKYKNEPWSKGIGFYPVGELVGLDLDHCRDKGTGVIEPWALNVIGRWKSKAYVEISPSRTGFHLWFHAHPLPKGVERTYSYHYLDPSNPDRRTGELCLGKKYLTVTGERYE